jgi:hypothetical protein
MADIEIPHPEGRKNEKPVGILIAIVAVVLAVIGSLGNNAANDRIVAEVKSSNGFSWYQAKRQREALNDLELKRIGVELASSPSPGRREALERLQQELLSKNREYKVENAGILATAEADRTAARIHGDRNDGFDRAEILLQVAVVLCTLTLLVESRIFLRIGLVVALVGMGVGARTHLGPTPPEPAAAAAGPVPTNSAAAPSGR